MAKKKQTTGKGAKAASGPKKKAVAKKKAAGKAEAKKAAPKKVAARKPAKGKAAKPAAAETPAPAAAADAPAVVEARALARWVRLSPQKARLVIDLIRGQDVGPALTTLRFARKRAAGPIEKVLRSAIANAEQKDENVDVDRLYVKYAVVNEGFRYKRVRAAPMGRAFVYKRRTAHIEIAVAERAARTS